MIFGKIMVGEIAIMKIPLLQTKLYIPLLRSELVARPRLIERLNEGLWQSQDFGRKLTLISAPAGFGKTTLVSEWIHRQVRGRGSGEAGGQKFTFAPVSEDASTSLEASLHSPPAQFAWLSLQESDNDPVRFLAYFVAALQTIEARRNIGKGMLSALQSPQPPPTEVVLTSLLNEIALLPDKIVLILDDYHLIEAQPIHQALTFLLDHLPPQMHLIIATREDPHLPLARLRARGQLTELRARDLRFTTAEAAEFLNKVTGQDLSTEDIAALESRTEGWIAGLQLAAISMRGYEDAAGFIKAFTGSHHFVLDYLIEEVLEGQSERVQTFLLQTAVLDRLCGSLCDAVLSRGAETQGSDASSESVSPSLTGERPPATLLPRSSAPPHTGPFTSSQDILEYLEHANLFIIPLDEERRWYRYHHLFADLLRQRLRQEQPDRIPALHIRASEWYKDHGFVDQAIEYALRGEAFERAARLIEEHVDAIWQRGEHTKLWRWLVALPVELVFSRPHLCILQAWDLFTSGRQDAAEQSLQAAEKTLDSSPDLAAETASVERDQFSGSDRMKIQGRAAAIRAFLASYRGDVQGINQYARQALEYLPEQDLTWRSTATVALGDAYSFNGELTAAYRVRLEGVEASKAAGNIYMILIASIKLAITIRQQGRLEQVIEICQQQLQLANESGLSQTGVVGWLLAIWGEVLAELNDLEGAIHRAKQGAELTECGHDVAMLGWSCLCLVRVLFTKGDLTGAEEIIQKMEKIGRETHVPPWITNQMAAWQARIWLVQDKLEAASQWGQERGLDVDGDPPFLHEIEYMVLARILIAQGRFGETTRLLERLLKVAEAGGRTTRMIEGLMLQALVFQAQEDTTRAITTLERALNLAEPRDYIRIFVDEGPPMAKLLTRMKAEGGRMKEYIHKLLAAFGKQKDVHPFGSAQDKPSSFRPQPLVEPLSERELEVLQLIAAGLTNQEIASRLFLTLNTVKVHNRNIYGKLGAHSRTQAVAEARALGVLSFT